MYTLTTKCTQPFPIQLPGRSLFFSKSNPTAQISDEEFASGTVQARLRLKHIKAEQNTEVEFATPDTLQLRQYQARLASKSKSRRRAQGAFR